jgi:uncharacterized delta-60 repeat protein
MVRAMALRKNLRRLLIACLLFAGSLRAEPSPEGLLDRGFGTQGLVTFSFNPAVNWLEEDVQIAIAPQQRVYLAASVGVTNGQGQIRKRIGLARLLMNGQLDPGFSGDGLSFPQLPVFADMNLAPTELIIRPDGKPVVVARRSGSGQPNRMVVCRYAVAGNFDVSYDLDGCAEPTLALLDQGEEAVDTALLLPDEAILLGGWAGVNPINAMDRDGIVVKLDSQGARDFSFGTQGYTRLRPVGSTAAFVVDLERQSDGRIVVIGRAAGVGTFVARLLANGALDTSFGINGYSTIGFADLHTLPSPHDFLGGGALDAEGRIYTCGYITFGGGFSNSVMAIARLTPSGALDPGFSGDGRLLRPLIDVLDTSSVVDCRTDAQHRLTLAVMTGTAAPTNPDFGAMRLDPDGNPDTRFSPDGTVRVALDTGGNGVGADIPVAMAIHEGYTYVAGLVMPVNGVNNDERIAAVRLGPDRMFVDGFE